MLERLDQAMEYIERHLDQRIEVAELGRIAVTSEYHFRRLFSALAGIRLSEYIRRRRLTGAGAEVLAGQRTLPDVAASYGYSSGEAFARAFRAVHGVGPPAQGGPMLVAGDNALLCFSWIRVPSNGGLKSLPVAPLDALDWRVGIDQSVRG